MLTYTQTKHQVINHILGCGHEGITDESVDHIAATIMRDRARGHRITTARICDTIDTEKA